MAPALLGAMNAPKYIGYHELATLPVKCGDTVTIPKGTVVRHRGKDKPAGRNFKVKVDHLLPGMTRSDYKPGHTQADARGMVQTLVNPAVRWAGTGGYWAECDVNHVTVA